MSHPGRTIFDAEALTRLSRVVACDPSPCGRWVAVQVARLDDDGKRYISDLWRLSATDPDAAPLRLTWGDHDDRSPRYRADGALLFVSARPTPSDEKGRWAQVWMLPPEGGEARPLTDEPLGVDAFDCGGGRIVVLASVWPGIPHDQQRKHATDRADKGSSILRYTTMPVRSWDHWLPAPATHLIRYEDGARTDLTPDADRDHRGSPWAMAANGRRAVISREQPGGDRLPESSLLVFDLDDGSSRLVPTVPRALIEGLAVSPDGRWAVGEVHARVDGLLGRPTLWRFDLEQGVAAPLTPEWDVHPVVCGLTADRVLVTAGVRGQVVPFSVDLHGGTPQRLIADGVGGSFRRLRALPDGGVVAQADSLLHPPEVCVLAGDGAKPRGLARLSGFDPTWAAAARVSEYSVPSSDGVEVHGLIVTPTGDGPHPGLLWVHGGPVGQHEDGWHWRWNSLVAASAGYAVSLPNPRGSTGYGQDFVEGIWNNAWGGVCYDDVMAAADHFEAHDAVDSRRIALMGASFGGYMTNWVGARSDRFRCLVSHAGVYRMSTFHGTSDWPAWFELQAGIDPGHPDFDRHSPHRLVHQWKTPTLVIHGEKDYRVPVSQALLLFEDLQRHGVESELVVFPDENHWILRPPNVRAWYAAWQDFVTRHLGDGPSAGA